MREEQAGYTTVSMQNWDGTQEFSCLTCVTQAVHRSLSSPFTVRAHTAIINILETEVCFASDTRYNFDTD